MLSWLIVDVAIQWAGWAVSALLKVCEAQLGHVHQHRTACTLCIHQLARATTMYEGLCFSKHMSAVENHTTWLQDMHVADHSHPLRVAVAASVMYFLTDGEVLRHAWNRLVCSAGPWFTAEGLPNPRQEGEATCKLCTADAVEACCQWPSRTPSRCMPIAGAQQNQCC